MDYKNVIWIKTEITDELSAVPEPTVQVCPPTTNVKEELLESVNQEFVDDPLLFTESTDCVKENPNRSLGPEDSENILCVPEFGPQLIKEEVLEFESDCLDERDPLSLPDDTELTSGKCAAESTWLTKIASQTGSTVSEETFLLGATGHQVDFVAVKSAIFDGNGTPGEDCFSKQDTEICTTADSVKEDNFTCSSCKQTFLSKYNLIMHVFIHIDGVRPPAHICKSCGEVFPNYDSLSEHSVMQKGVCLAECPQRSTVTNEFGSLRPREVVCKRPLKCDIAFTAAESLRPQPSDVYRESTTQSYHLKSPSVTNTGDRTHICEVCGISFTLASSLKRHSNLHTGLRSNKCDTCGKSFKYPNRLKQHILRCSGVSRHKCDVCGKSYTELNNLRTHMKKHIGDRQHTCDACGKSFSDSGCLKRHRFIHTGERSHKCDLCGKSFITIFSLKRHQVTHTNKGPHSCDVCGKSFAALCLLKRHSLIHTGERPHECNVCGSTFAQSGALKRHLVTHTGKRPYTCDICGKSYTDAGSLRMHKLTHTGEKPYQCHVCGKSFTHLYRVKVHSITHIMQST